MPRSTIREMICWERVNSRSDQVWEGGAVVLAGVQVPWMLPKRFQERKAGPDRKVAISSGVRPIPRKSWLRISS
jgi:hypothetical protein